MTINPLDYTIKELNQLSIKKGRLLLAEPFMDDPYFKRSVVLLTEYNKEGALGFILNKPLDVKLRDVIKDFPEFDAPIFMGGPVQTDTLFFIHSQGELIKDSVKINSKLFWSGNFEKLKELVIDQQIFPHEIKFFIGYSGWDYDQLNKEVKDESWLISKNHLDSIKKLNNDNLWHKSLNKMGGKHAVLSNFPENPSLN